MTKKGEAGLVILSIVAVTAVISLVFMFSSQTTGSATYSAVARSCLPTPTGTAVQCACYREGIAVTKGSTVYADFEGDVCGFRTGICKELCVLPKPGFDVMYMYDALVGYEVKGIQPFDPY